MSEQDAAIVNPNFKQVNVVWLDVNSRLAIDYKPDLLPNIQAINNSLYNLLRCPIGARGPIFQPEYGTILYRLIHEPLDPVTANKIRIAFIQAIQRWEPRVILDMNRTTVQTNYTIAGYLITLYYTIAQTVDQGVAQFAILQGQS